MDELCTNSREEQAKQSNEAAPLTVSFCGPLSRASSLRPKRQQETKTERCTVQSECVAEVERETQNARTRASERARGGTRQAETRGGLNARQAMEGRPHRL